MNGLPVVHMYALVWNEMRILPYFFRHYDQFVDRFCLFDTGSTDGTVQFLERLPHVEVRPISLVRNSSCVAMSELKSTLWMESRGSADWVIVCDVDELLIGDVASVLRSEATIAAAAGWEMVTDRFPTTTGQIYDEVNAGCPSEDYAKTVLFRPNEIDEIRFTTGCHRCDPAGRIVWASPTKLNLCHFKLLGFDYVSTRYAELRGLLTAVDRRHRYGWQYFLSVDELRQRIERFSAASQTVAR